jgi:hypothetical protein
MAADLGHFAQAQPGGMGGGEGGAPEAVGAHALDAHLLGQLGDGHLGAADAEGLAGLARENPAALSGGALLAPLLQPLAGNRGQGETAAMAGLGDLPRNGDGASLHVAPGQQGGLSDAHRADAHQNHQGGITGAGRGQHGGDLLSGEHGGTLDSSRTSGTVAEQGAIGGAARGGGHGTGAAVPALYAYVMKSATLPRVLAVTGPLHPRQSEGGRRWLVENGSA